MNPFLIQLSFHRLIFLTFFLISMPARAVSDTVSVSASTLEALSGRTMALAREAAISKALTLAVLEVAARMRPDSSGELLQELRRDSVLRYVKVYRVLNEVSVGDYLKVEIEAEVDSGEIAKAFDDFGMDSDAVLKGKSSSGKPSIYIHILENPESSAIIKTLSTAGIKAEISAVLRGGRYRISEESGDGIRLETYLGVRAIENRAGEISYNTAANVFMRAWTREGKLITEVSESSYSSGRSLENASLQALKKAASGAAKKLTGGLGQGRNKDLSEEDIEIVFRGLTDYIQYERIDRILAKSPAGIDIKKRVLRGGGKVTFVVHSKMKKEQLSKTIEDSLPGDLTLRLDQSAGHDISFSVY